MDHVYLGYSNPQKAWVLRGHDIVVLKDGDKAKVLTDECAADFMQRVRELTHHTCGVRQNEAARQLLAATGNTDQAYKLIFNSFMD